MATPHTPRPRPRQPAPNPAPGSKAPATGKATKLTEEEQGPADARAYEPATDDLLPEREDVEHGHEEEPSEP